MATIDQATAAALEFDLARVSARYQQRHSLASPDVALRERELKRYLVLRSKLPADTLPTPRVVDELWHEFILHTRDYSAFCETLGHGFIHHVPAEPGRAREKQAEDATRYAELLAYYEEVFREAPPADVWPPLGAASFALGDCDASGGNKVVEEASTQGSAFGDCEAAVEEIDVR